MAYNVNHQNLSSDLKAIESERKHDFKYLVFSFTHFSVAKATLHSQMSVRLFYLSVRQEAKQLKSFIFQHSIFIFHHYSFILHSFFIHSSFILHLFIILHSSFLHFTIFKLFSLFLHELTYLSILEGLWCASSKSIE